MKLGVMLLPQRRTQVPAAMVTNLTRKVATAVRLTTVIMATVLIAPDLTVKTGTARSVLITVTALIARALILGADNGDRPQRPRYNNDNGDRPYRPRYNSEDGDRPQRPRYNNEGGDRPYRPRFNSGGGRPGGYGNRDSYSRPVRRSADYDPNAKYSKKKQIEYKEQFVDPNELSA